MSNPATYGNRKEPKRCQFILISGINKGNLCLKSVFNSRNGNKYCERHREIVRKQEQERLEEQFVITHGMTREAFNAIELKRVAQEKKILDDKFFDEHGMTEDEFNAIECRYEIAKYELQRKREDDEREKKAIDELAEKIAKDPDYQIKEARDSINDYLKGYFDRNDCYFEELELLKIAVDEDDVMTISDGRRFAVQVVELTD